MAERKNTFGRIHDLPVTNFWRQFHQLPTPACTYIHMYTHTCTCMCVHVYVCMYVSVRVRMCMQGWAPYMCVYMCLSVCLYICVCACVYYVCVCIRIIMYVGVCSCHMNLTFVVNYTCRYFRDATLNICKCPSKDLSIEDTGWQSNSSFFQEELAYYKTSAVLCYVCVIDNVCV